MNPNLKSAEEWLDTGGVQDVFDIYTFETHEITHAIKQIQLNAYKAGMTEAAEIVSQHPHTATIQGAILSARDKKETL